MNGHIIPSRLALRPRDRRGYPIPYIVYIDAEGRPHFTINDASRVVEVIERKLCALCGKPLGDNAWFIGGPSAAFHVQGVYLDPPSHKDCATYALKVCPFLALRYGGRIDDKTLRDDARHEDVTVVQDNNGNEAQPAIFVFSRASSYHGVEVQPGQLYIIPKKPWRAVEFWRHGEQVSSDEAWKLTLEDPKLSCQPVELTYWPRK